MILNLNFSDYVTEKFFTVIQHDVIPVVLGGANYSEISPPNSFIDTKSFATSRDLAHYLKYLLKNQTAYKEYFRWKSNFKVYPNQDEYLGRAMCQLCERLNSEIQQKKVYENMDDWWRKGGNCQF